MNLYDKKVARCTKCGKTVGEIEITAKIVFLVCKNCKNEELQKISPKKDGKYDFLNKRMVEITQS